MYERHGQRDAVPLSEVKVEYPQNVSAPLPARRWVCDWREVKVIAANLVNMTRKKKLPSTLLVAAKQHLALRK